MDIFFFEAIHSLTQKKPLLDGFAVFFAKYLIYLLVLGAIFFIFSFKNIREKLFVFVVITMTVILSRGILTELARFFYDRERPFETLGFEPLFLDLNPSFPSGHTAFLFALSIAIFYFSRFWGWWFIGFSLLVGLSRIFVGIHWPSDILGGIAVAFVSFWIVNNLLKNYKPKSSIIDKV